MREGKNNEAPEVPVKRRGRPFLQPLAMALVCLVFVLLFFTMAMMDLRRLEKTLLDVFENKGLSIIKGVERLSQNKFNNLMGIKNRDSGIPGGLSNMEVAFSVQESLVSYLIDLARDIDLKEESGLLSRAGLQELVSAENLQAIALLDDRGEFILKSGSVPKALFYRIRPLFEGVEEISIDLFNATEKKGSVGFVGFRRKGGNGAILLVLDRKAFRYWGSKVIIQEAIDEVGWSEGVRYLVVKDRQGRYLASAGDFSEGSMERGKMPEVLTSKDQRPPTSRRVGKNSHKILEVLAPFQLEDKVVGLAMVGIDTKRVETLLKKNQGRIFLSMGLLIAIAIFAIWILYSNQNRHFLRLQNMREHLLKAQRLSALGRLAAGVAHEIRNPLNAISMATQRIQREYSPAKREDNSEFEQITGVIGEEIRRLNAIIEDFLGFSRSRKLEFRPCSIVDLIQRMILLIREEADSRKIKIQGRWGDFHPVISIDSDKMEQALLNIVRNALESISGEGSITISIEPLGKDRVSIKITDTGTGISPEDIDQIFNPDYTTKEKGLGLGLPIAHEIIRAHGGVLRAHSNKDAGTTFEILLLWERKI